MAKIVRQHNVGIVANSFAPRDIANILNALSSEDIYKYKMASDRAAKELNAENNSKILESMLDGLLANENSA